MGVASVCVYRPPVVDNGFADNFNRAGNLNGSVTSTGAKPWAGLSGGTFTTSGTQVVSPGTSNTKSYVNSPALSGTVSIKFSSVGASGRLLFWLHNTSNYWFVEASSGNLAKVDSGSVVDLPQVLGAFANGDILTIVYDQTSATFFKNGVQVGVVQTRSAFTGGHPGTYVGIGSGDATTQFDDLNYSTAMSTPGWLNGDNTVQSLGAEFVVSVEQDLPYNTLGTLHTRVRRAASPQGAPFSYKTFDSSGALRGSGAFSDRTSGGALYVEEFDFTVGSGIGFGHLQVWASDNFTGDTAIYYPAGHPLRPA